MFCFQQSKEVVDLQLVYTTGSGFQIERAAEENSGHVIFFLKYSRTQAQIRLFCFSMVISNLDLKIMESVKTYFMSTHIFSYNFLTHKSS